jgi:hypothetical protein
MSSTKEILSESSTLKSIFGVFIVCLTIVIDWSTIYLISSLHTFIPLCIEVKVPPRLFVLIWVSKRFTQALFSPADTFLSGIMDFWIILEFSWYAVTELIHETLLFVGKVFIFATSRSE